MNILLVGGTCSLMNNIILKLRKEGHRVFLLTGDKYKHNKYEKVFERYDFPYDSENLNEVIESVNPDVTILLGAFDTNYLWNGEERETVHFISHMVNILVAYSVVNRGKLIYLSSDEVFSGDYPDDITEGEKFSGWIICTVFRRIKMISTISVRACVWSICVTDISKRTRTTPFRCCTRKMPWNIFTRW